MKIQYGRLLRRLFQSLFNNMECHYKEGNELYAKLHAQDFSNPLMLDQELWAREKAASLSSFIMGMAGIEALANYIYLDFGLRKKEDLPTELLNKRQKNKTFEFWNLADKIYFLPSLCNLDFNPPDSYFKKDSKEFKLFEELVEIRNNIMHGRPTSTLIRILHEPGNIKGLFDNFSENYWPRSKIQKDFTSFNFDCAKTTYENIIWVRNSLIKFIDKLDEKYLREEQIKLTSPVIDEQHVTLKKPPGAGSN